MGVTLVALAVCAAGSVASAVLRQQGHPATEMIPPFVDYLWLGLLAAGAVLYWAERRRRDR